LGRVVEIEEKTSSREGLKKSIRSSLLENRKKAEGLKDRP